MADVASPGTDERERPGYLPALRFQRLTPLFDRVVQTTMREKTFKRSLVEQADLQPNQRVLDLGCGTGTLAILVKEREPRCDVSGVDADPEILEIARRKASDAGVDVDFESGLSTELPYDAGSFDRVLSTLFFHHLMPEDKRKTLAEIRRVLRPGGQLHVADFTVPVDPLQRLLSWQVRVFDGVERTRENFTGRLPALVAETGLDRVTEHRRLRTGMGTLALFSASGPAPRPG